MLLRIGILFSVRRGQIEVYLLPRSFFHRNAHNMSRNKFARVKQKRRRYSSLNRRQTQTAVYIVLICAFICFSVIKANRPLDIEDTGYGKIEDVGGGQSVTVLNEQKTDSSHFDLDSVPEYSGTPTYVLNDNRPLFTEEDYAAAKDQYIFLSELDYLGRCGVCEGSLGKDTLPEEDRGDISSVRPSGWHQEMYPTVISKNDGALYNRCHLLMYALTGLNAEPRNLITGTEYLNNKGMLPYEMAVVNWIEKEGGRVLYRVTPVFEGMNLLCSGVHIEAGDVETGGDRFHINVYCYNVEPGISIDYATGYSKKELDLDL